MSIALALALLTGACWCAIGITYSQAVDRGLHPAVMTCLCGLGVAAITTSQIDWSTIARVDLPLVVTSMTIAGLAMTAGMVAMQQAMKRGGHGLAWAIAQSGLVWPFIVAVSCHGERPNLLAWIGLLVILASLPMLRERQSPTTSNAGSSWYGLALFAWAMIGLQQSAFQWPSLSAMAPDPAGIRVPIMYASVCISSSCLLLFSRARSSRAPETPIPWRAIGALVLLACLTNAIAQTAMIQASDRLAALDAGGIAFAIAIATSTTLFVAFTCWRRGERPQPRTWVGLGISLVGAILLSL